MAAVLWAVSIGFLSHSVDGGGQVVLVGVHVDLRCRDASVSKRDLYGDDVGDPEQQRCEGVSQYVRIDFATDGCNAGVTHRPLNRSNRYGASAMLGRGDQRSWITSDGVPERRPGRVNEVAERWR